MESHTPTRWPRDGPARDRGPEGGSRDSRNCRTCTGVRDLDRGVADFAGAIGRSVKKPAVEYQSAADPGPDGDTDGHLGAAGPPRHHSPSTAQLRIVIQHGGNSDTLLDAIPKRHVNPAEVARRQRQHDTTLGVERRGSAPDTNAYDLAFGCSRRHSTTASSAARLLIRPITASEPSWPGSARSAMPGKVRTILGHTSDHEIRSPNVDANDVTQARLSGDG